MAILHNIFSVLQINFFVPDIFLLFRLYLQCLNFYLHIRI